LGKKQPNTPPPHKRAGEKTSKQKRKALTAHAVDELEVRRKAIEALLGLKVVVDAAQRAARDRPLAAERVGRLVLVLDLDLGELVDLLVVAVVAVLAVRGGGGEPGRGEGGQRQERQERGAAGHRRRLFVCV
jgi:hypothetical protein